MLWRLLLATIVLAVVLLPPAPSLVRPSSLSAPLCFPACLFACLPAHLDNRRQPAMIGAVARR